MTFEEIKKEYDGFFKDTKHDTYGEMFIIVFAHQCVKKAEIKFKKRIDLLENKKDLPENNKKRRIAGIKGRILDEYRKHKDLDWAEIAAIKIYNTYFKK